MRGVWGSANEKKMNLDVRGDMVRMKIVSLTEEEKKFIKVFVYYNLGEELCETLLEEGSIKTIVGEWKVSLGRKVKGMKYCVCVNLRYMGEHCGDTEDEEEEGVYESEQPLFNIELCKYIKKKGIFKLKDVATRESLGLCEGVLGITKYIV